jgi:hypothetical protein
MGRIRHSFPGVPAAAKQLPMRVNLKVAIRSHRLAGARESVPEGHLKVAHYEVVGRVFSKAARPARTIDWLLRSPGRMRAKD